MNVKNKCPLIVSFFILASCSQGYNLAQKNSGSTPLSDPGIGGGTSSIAVDPLPGSSSSSSETSSSSESSSSSEASSSSQSSVVESSSSSSSLQSSSSSESSVASSSSASTYDSCDAVPLQYRITIESVDSGDNEIPDSSFFYAGYSMKFCMCRPREDGTGFVVYAPNVYGILLGEGDAESFFIRRENCRHYHPNYDDEEGDDGSHQCGGDGW